MSEQILTEEQQERRELALERLKSVPEENILQEPFLEFFRREARFLLYTEEIRETLKKEKTTETDLRVLEDRNQRLYGELLAEHYGSCWGNPDYAAGQAGLRMGRLLSFLYAELRGMIPCAYEDRQWDMLVMTELFLEIYGLFVSAAADRRIPEESSVQDALYWYVMDYSREMMDQRNREALDPDESFIRDLVMQSDLTDIRYLYRFGEYVSENEKQLAAFLNTLSQEEIDAIAKTWTEGYRIGFEVQRKEIRKKKTVNVRYSLGFERIVRAAVLRFRDMGLESVIYRAAFHSINKRSHLRIGFLGPLPNPQFEYDHRNDAAIYTDERFITRKLQNLQGSYESRKTEAAVHGGPACMDTFGELPFTPEAKESCCRLSGEQQALQVRYQNESGQIVNRYIRGDERSFTIIAYPVPEIGSRFPEIFRETEKINNLDYRKYQKIQQKLIDALDQGDCVHVQGRRGNRTDLTIALHPLEKPEIQTKFENCVADVNIPVGEVFTSPVLKGTNGVLHVSRVYLEDFQFRDLCITVKDGMTADYSCANFGKEEDNRRFIEENILYHHPSLPMGEFAVGTNTTAYRMAARFHIAEKLPILIAEKMGPHFAFGDTCYSWQEEVPVYNPDGREMIARDNEKSLLRKTDPGKAYFGCHTDITIPYEELGHIRVIRPDGSIIPIIEEGYFVLPGTEELNEPLKGLI